MNDYSFNPEAGADLGGASAESQGRPNLTVADPVKPPGVLTGKPLLAPNSGSVIPEKLLSAFAEASPTSPEWTRLPAPRKRDDLTGLSRSSMNEAIERGDIRSITVRQPGATRGIKLINVASVRGWLARLDAEQNGLAKKGGGQ